MVRERARLYRRPRVGGSGRAPYLLCVPPGRPPHSACRMLLVRRPDLPHRPDRGTGHPQDRRGAKRLEIQIAGESLFNDGVAVALFVALSAVAATGKATPGAFAMLLPQVAIGGTLVGLVTGYIAYWMMKSIEQHIVETFISLALAMGGYALAEALHTSGRLPWSLPG